MDNKSCASSRSEQYCCVRGERFSTRQPPYFASQRLGRRGSQLSMASRNRASKSVRSASTSFMAGIGIGYEEFCGNGGAGYRNRTGDLLITSQLLYLLS